LNDSAIAAASVYREWPAPRPWRPTVVCRWEQRVVGGEYVQRVLPDGCADIIVDDAGRGLVVGPSRHVTMPRLAPGVLSGIRFRTEAIGPVFGVAASELADGAVPLDAVVVPRQAREVVEMLVTGREASGWWADVDTDPRLRAACSALAGTHDSVARVAETIGLSVRQLRRLLLDATGQGPKTLQRVGRLRRFLSLADQHRAPWSLADLAAAAGYADQAHLTREVRDLAGTTPAGLLRERSRAAQ
jgi:AraC-like DNA-binding protein